MNRSGIFSPRVHGFSEEKAFTVREVGGSWVFPGDMLCLLAVLMLTESVKKVFYRAEQGKTGFIRSTLTPIDHKHQVRFGWWDMVTLAALIVGGLALARVLMAH